MANNQIVISRIQNRRGRRENLPQPLRPGEIGLTADTEQVWIGGDPELMISGVKAYTDKNTTTAQDIVNNNIAEVKFVQSFAGLAYASLVTSLTNSSVLTLVPEDIGWDEAYRGTILNINITNPGSGYTDGVYPLNIVSVTGSAAAAEVTISGGVAVDVNVINGGTNYRFSNTTVSLVYGTGAGATFSVTEQDVLGYSVFVALDPTIDADNSISNLETEILASPVSTLMIECYSLGANDITDPNHVAPNIVSPRTFDTAGFMPIETHTAATVVVNLINRVNASTPNEITGLVHTNLNIEIGCCDGRGGSAVTSGAMVAYVGPDVPLAPSTWSPISFNTEIADDGNYWEATEPDVFTISQTGWYIVTGTIYYTANIGSYAVAISVNGDTTEPFLATQHQNTSNPVIQRCNVASVVYFEGGDVVRLLSYTNTSARSFSHATFEIVGAASLGGGDTGGPAPQAIAPYEVPFHFNRDVIQQEPGQVLASFLFTQNVNYYTTSPSVAYAAVPPATEQQVFRLLKNGIQVGTVTFNIGSNTGVVTFPADESYTIGDRIDVVGPNTVDPAIDDVAINLVGNISIDVNVVAETPVITTDKSVSGTGTIFAPVQLTNDLAVPGNDKYYGTNFAGARGWFDLPSGVTNLGYDAPTRTITSDTGNDTVLPLVTGTEAGLAPASGGGTINFLRADGTWAEPPGGGVGSLQGIQGIQGADGAQGIQGEAIQGVQGIMGAGGQANITWRDEGIDVAAAGAVSIVDFVGPGVTATFDTGKLTVDITGGGGSGSASVTTADTPPAMPNDGDLWWDSVTGMLMIYYDDGTSSQWVSATVTPSVYITPTQTIGDLIVRGSLEDERLAVGNEGEVLTVVGGLPAWLLPTLEQKQTLISDNYELVIADAGNHIYKSSGNAATLTIPSNSSIPFNLGTTITIVNDDTENMTIDITTDTLVWSPSGGTGSRTLAQYGVATLLKVAPTRWVITGTGLT